MKEVYPARRGHNKWIFFCRRRVPPALLTAQIRREEVARRRSTYPSPPPSFTQPAWCGCCGAEVCNVEPLDFDGENDSIFQEYNNEGREFMEYLEDYGYFEDVPLDFMEAKAREHYPHIFGKDKNKKEFWL